MNTNKHASRNRPHDPPTRSKTDLYPFGHVAGGSHASRLTHHASRLTYLILTLLILTYAIYFSWYSINRHNTLNSYAADLSLIDQPMWNTVLGPGDFMELTWGRQQQPRLAEHFEPILVPLASLFLIWDDVRIILIAKSVALAMGALPIFWLARWQFDSLLPSQFPTKKGTVKSAESRPPPHPPPRGGDTCPSPCGGVGGGGVSQKSISP
ncbi:DUF2079 domain-containing protein, partial [Anaerolineales bacterium HSG6]|nr:DUF2079 domain-containing protein [Anaerolineales bacterium HSG6]